MLGAANLPELPPPTPAFAVLVGALRYRAAQLA
jgi:hypothetical protein